MLDFNHKSKFSDSLNEIIDAAIIDANSKQPKRDYLGASRLGVSCSRVLQYEYLNIPKDKDFTGKILRIFEAGHLFEELAINWLRNAGIDLCTTKSTGWQFGFSVADGKIRGHVDGIINNAPNHLKLSFPMLWECKSLNNKSWNDVSKKGVVLSKPIYAAQIALYQAYMETSIDGISSNPCLFTAINKDTAELYHELVPFNAELAQRSSDRAVNIIKACEAKEWLPRISNDSTYFECKFCSWQKKCWSAES